MLVTMSKQENRIRITSSTKKTTAVAMGAEPFLQLPATRKQAKLKELPSLLKVVVNPTLDPAPQASGSMRKTGQGTVVPGTDADLDVDPHMFAPYASDIYEYLRCMEMEEKRWPLPDYMDKIQIDVTAYMREILLEWLIVVAYKNMVVPETLYLTASYFDRFLSLHTLNSNMLQPLGVSCMVIASKYEQSDDIRLGVNDLCYLAGDRCTREEVVEMETGILHFLKFELGNPTIKTFLRRLTRAAQKNCKFLNLVKFLGCYFSELSLLDYGCLRFLLSMVAASVIFLSRFTIQPNVHPWSLVLQHYSGYRLSDLKNCVLAIYDIVLNRKGRSFLAARNKYMQQQFNCVATLSLHPNIHPIYFDDVIK